MKAPVKKKITTNATTALAATSGAVKQIVIACSNAGTTWTLRIEDGDGFVLVPTFTLTVPTDGLPKIIVFDQPIYMSNGISAVTAGAAAGQVQIWVSFGDTASP